MCATVKRLCLWMLLLSSMRRSSRGELRGERRGEMVEGERRCPLGLSGCSRFSRRIFTRSSFRPECLGMGGTARVSWWVTPMPACWAMPAPASPPPPPPPAKANERTKRRLLLCLRVSSKFRNHFKKITINMHTSKYLLDDKLKRSSAGNSSQQSLPLRRI